MTDSEGTVLTVDPHATKTTWYVTMTDKCMSGWGPATGKTNKLIFVCDDLKEAEIVEANAQGRNDMKRINVTPRMPYYNKRTHYTQIKTKDDYSSWYKAGFFG